MTGSLALAEPAAAAPSLTASSAEQDFFARLNHERTSRGLAPLANDTRLAGTSRSWSSNMRSRNVL